MMKPGMGYLETRREAWRWREEGTEQITMRIRGGVVFASASAWLPWPLAFNDVEGLLEDSPIFYGDYQLRYLWGGRGKNQGKGARNSPAPALPSSFPTSSPKLTPSLRFSKSKGPGTENYL